MLNHNQITDGIDSVSYRAVIVGLLAVPVGIIAGFGAIGFRYLISFFHNLFFSGTLSFYFNSDVHFLSRWGWLVVLVPAVGITIANIITEKWAPEAKGHGVPEVIGAVMENQGRIRPTVSLVKSLASAITIGSGGSVGREGPIVQIGASFGSTLGQLFKLPSKEIIILVGAGVAGGIGATFNAPIGGIMFAMELILPEYSIMTIMPMAISSVIATHISVVVLGSTPAFVLPSYLLVSSTELVFYLALGFIAGFAAIAFIHTLYGLEDFFDRIPLHSNVKSVIGGVIIGCIGLASLKIFGHYFIFGVGYAFLTEVLNNNILPFLILIGLLFVKIIATNLTLAAGGSGGIFAPSLFMGATIGAIVGVVVNYFFPEITASPSAYAIVGMAAMVSGTTGASLTSIIMIFEMTRNYEIMLPLTLSVVIAHFVVSTMYHETIYTKKLSRRGILIQLNKSIPILKTLHVQDILNRNLLSCTSNCVISEVLEKMRLRGLGVLPVIDNGRVVGTIGFEELYRTDKDTAETIETIISTKDITIRPNRNLFQALTKMEEASSSILVVADAGGIRGFVTRNGIITSYLRKKDHL